MKKRLLMTLAASATVVLVGCSNDKTEHKEVKVSLPTEAKADKLDAQRYDSAMPVYSAVYEPLVEYDKDKSVKAGLADKWTVDENGKHYRFHLKKDIKFSDGSTLNAEAVKFSLDRAKALNKDTTVETLKQLDKVVIKDSHTVDIYLKQPSNQVLNELTQARPLRIMSPHAVEGHKVDGKFKEAIGTGAFTVASTGKEQTTFKPNKYFNHDKPVDYDLTFQTIEDGDSRNAAIQSGSIDITGGALGMLSDQQLKTYQQSKALSVEDKPSTVSHFMGFNPENKILQQREIRQAITESIDTAQLSDRKMKGIFQEGVQFVNDDNQPRTKFDIKHAQHLLNQQGYHKNQQGIFEKDGKPLAFNLVIQTAEFPNWKEKAQQVQDELKQAGIKVNIKTLDAQTYYDTLWTTKDYDLIFYRTYSDALMPYQFMNSVFKQIDGKPGVLADDRKLSQQLDDFPQQVSTQSQQQAFNDIFKHFNASYYGVPIAYPRETFVTSERIQQFEFSGLTDAPIDYKRLKVKD